MLCCSSVQIFLFFLKDVVREQRVRGVSQELVQYCGWACSTHCGNQLVLAISWDRTSLQHCADTFHWSFQLFLYLSYHNVSLSLALACPIKRSIIQSHKQVFYLSDNQKTCTDVISPGDDGDDVLYFCHFYYLGLILFSECYIVFWLSGCRNQNETRQKLIKNVYLPVWVTFNYPALTAISPTSSSESFADFILSCVSPLRPLLYLVGWGYWLTFEKKFNPNYFPKHTN